MKFPEYIILIGDEDAGVTLRCHHESHDDYEELCYLGWSHRTKPVVNDINEMLAYAQRHVVSHQK